MNRVSRTAFNLGKRSFYSHAHPSTPFYTPQQQDILSRALKHVPEHGFTPESLSMAAREAGYLDITHALFPKGAWSIAEYHMVTERERLKDHLPALEEEKGVGRKIRRLCVERLKANKDVIGHWQEALALMALPKNVLGSMAELAKLADEMWYLTGDASVDMNWYTKRASLASVYATTEVYMTQDTSADFANTWTFLDRRLGDVQTLGKGVGNVTEYISFTAHSIGNILNSRGMRL